MLEVNGRGISLILYPCAPLNLNGLIKEMVWNDVYYLWTCTAIRCSERPHCGANWMASCRFRITMPRATVPLLRENRGHCSKPGLRYPWLNCKCSPLDRVHELFNFTFRPRIWVQNNPQSLQPVEQPQRIDNFLPAVDNARF